MPPAKPATAPTTNYGGTGDPLNEILYSKKQYDSGNKGWAANNATQYYGKLTPEEAALVKGMNTQQLEAYINNKNKTSNTLTTTDPRAPQPELPPMPAMPSAPSNGGYTSPVNMGEYAPMTREQIEAEAQARIDAQIREREAAAKQAKEGMQTSYNRMYENINEDRALENSYNERNLSPFSGKSDYALGMVEQQRGRTDRENQQDLQSRLASIDVSLKDFIDATPEQKQAMMNELTRMEREYGLAADAQAFGQFDSNRNYGLNYAGVYGYGPGGQMTAAMQNQMFSQGIQEGQLTGMYKGQSTLDNKRFNVDTALAYGDRAGMILTPQQDVSGYPRQIQSGKAPQTLEGQNQQFQQGMQQKQFDRGVYESDRSYQYTQGRDKVADAQWEREFNRIKEQQGMQNALAWAQQNLNQAEFDDRSAQGWAGLDWQMQQGGSAGYSYNGMTSSQVLSSVRKLYADEDGMLPTEGKSREEMFETVADFGLPPDQTRQVLFSLGFSKEEVDSMLGNYPGK
ncbi:hypothetical protein DNH61_11825 [Paenibacillus sambharensis]|uniref:Uncharacterized protein n=1 Tax=Paenibacillus sambharensis TaxID=1803190 RepID=A0A2W1LJQ6_9BACL|nr:hypothetical protein [Paenibacillus sambharensis]PZD95242.1 hypothetical protein DNH61_11825 [Paenibacillus sambharensis]